MKGGRIEESHGITFDVEISTKSEYEYKEIIRKFRNGRERE